ncbi:MAG: 1-deoxy-D-xylulose-5-phosphate synthase [SAR324 cluster bacterium]|uniref:1-deoxy-D-xylulose-5-phosphate synthase n=1 Tax=SAR324 cluster bacterium TaxID=2024889 RepID=A0A7X9FRU2_9DELT|nr:1-deoxy-D-xylulose-5-phosphate synthase [SAR324 cluster bacterium]
MKKILDTLTLPEDLRGLSLVELEQLCEELRDELIDSVSSTGGHFASSLGATEISVALHHVFNTPCDKLVWDVGHQAYVHKMLTGRRNLIKDIRKAGGISGFLKRNESKFDSFGAGHAGTSISAAVGMAVALQHNNQKNYVVAIIGDASISNGMAFEALNHAGALGLKRLIVVLNDNEMSISPNVGALSRIFSKVVTSKASTKARKQIKILRDKGYVPEIVYKTLDRWEEATQSFFCHPAMLFENFGFRYIGPIDGHNMGELIHSLEAAKEQDVPVLVHAVTTKGKGYRPAEENPIEWHGVTPFNREAGTFITSNKSLPSFTQIFGDTLVSLCKDNPNLIGITAAMPNGTGLDRLAKEVPNSFFDVGICEQHAVTFAAGLACEGFHPVCAIYSTFLQRAYDQILHDVCIQNLPVIFAIDRAGVVGNDGETHQGVFDISYLRSIPNMTIMSPKDENELRHMLFTAVQYNGPIALRYPRGASLGVDLDKELKALEIGKAEIVRRGHDVLFICFGPMLRYAQEVASRLEAEIGVTSTLINARFAKPLDEELLEKEIPNYEIVCTIEDNTILGGFGSAVLEFINRENINTQSTIRLFGVIDSFLPHASQSEQHKICGCDSESIYRNLRKDLRSRKIAVVG